MAKAKASAPVEENESTDLVVAGTDGAVVSAAPSFMAKGDAGKENIGTKDVEIPWLKLLQGTSPGIHENGWRAGNFLHSVLEEEVPGADGMLITVITALTPRYMLFNPLEQGGGILARAEDGIHWNPPNHSFDVKVNKGVTPVTWTTKPTVAASGLDKWGTYDPNNPNSPPAADLQYRYICVSPSHPEFGAFMILMQRSAIAAAKRLNSYLRASEVDSFGLVFRIRSKWEDKGPDDKKFLWTVSRAGFVASQDAYEKNREVYETFKDMDIGMHQEEQSASADTGSDAAPDDKNSEY